VQKRARQLVLDIVAAVCVVPLGYAAWVGTRSAWRVLHPPRRPVRHTPASFGMAAERVTVRGADDLPLAGWFVPGEPGRDVVVLSHGVGRDSGMLMPLARTIHDAGFHVLTFDLRNHGDSGSDRLLRGQSGRYTVDHLAVVRYAAERPETRGRRVGCVAFSLSAWTALEAARLRPELVRAVVCDSAPQLDARAGLGRTFDAGRGRLPALLRGPVLYRVTRAAFLRAVVFFLQPQPWPMELGDHSIRLLFISGELDPIARPVDLAAQLRWYPRGEHWLVPRVGHMQAHLRVADEYGDRVLAALTAGLDAAEDRPPAAPGGGIGVPP
jgi:pimeloyl-ACP methyl ester carboxylesterase